jgi:hypothetical protein
MFPGVNLKQGNVQNEVWPTAFAGRRKNPEKHIPRRLKSTRDDKNIRNVNDDGVSAAGSVARVADRLRGESDKRWMLS